MSFNIPDILINSNRLEVQSTVVIQSSVCVQASVNPWKGFSAFNILNPLSCQKKQNPSFAHLIYLEIPGQGLRHVSMVSSRLLPQNNISTVLKIFKGIAFIRTNSYYIEVSNLWSSSELFTRLEVKQRIWAWWKSSRSARKHAGGFMQASIDQHNFSQNILAVGPTF